MTEPSSQSSALINCMERAQSIPVSQLRFADFVQPALGCHGIYAFFAGDDYQMTDEHTDDKEAIHKLGVISESLQTHTNGKRTLHLRFFHDQGGMPEYYSQRTYCSIPLYEVTADSVSFTIQTYDGSVTKRFAIK